MVILGHHFWESEDLGMIISEMLQILSIEKTLADKWWSGHVMAMNVAEKRPISYRRSGKNLDVESRGIGGPFPLYILREEWPESFIFGLVTFQILFGKTRKVVIFMIYGFLDASMTPKTSYVSFWAHQIAPNNSRKPSRSIFGKYSFWKTDIRGNRKARKNTRGWKSEDMSDVCLFKISTWNQYLSKLMEWDIL